ncbi:hypothetical protein W97_07947 [Coniosporium apollinis CBS 100218]|uniref:Major facilitator superfamily (MFS) profile domain-containing protein n=1 Tax=Coniosporium apollinis (strain CBS 100218) TaxID=1168221 RepID=R7Z3U9_CONA1|nr:uncharacterized protein W97_07947 [Coniosporium apollinis CBS 100218]EON68689.1 hypothetical protein W97_07947 [Coniosporium apollinis CBS 100218]
MTPDGIKSKDQDPSLSASALASSSSDLPTPPSPAHSHSDDDSISRASSLHSYHDPAESKRSPSANKAASVLSRQTTSSIKPPAITVPRKERRGLFAHVAVVREVTDAQHYSNKTKWSITFVIACAAAAAPLGSAIVLPALLDIAADFNASASVTNFSVAFYMLSLGIFPLWWSSFSETLGRRTIYLVSFALFIVFNVLSAVSTGIGMFIVMRLLSGGAGASVQAVGAGTIADLWEPKERGRAMGIFYLGPLCGPLFAPIVGGAMAQGLGWRSTQWFLVVYGGLTWIGILFCLPETLKKRRDVVAEAERDAAQEEEEKGKVARPQLQRVSTRQSVAQTSKKWAKLFHRCFIDPLSVILYLRFPAVALTVYYASIAFGTLYFLNISIQETFSKPPYNFSTTIVGLLYIPNSLGYLVASVLGGRWIDSIMKREARKAGRYDQKGKLVFRPEDRMKENAWLGAIMFPGALLWYGWCVQKGVFWFAPILANFFFGVGSMLVFALATTMLTEFMPRRASSGIAVNNLMRNLFSFTGAIAAEPIIAAIGNGWLFTILGVVSFVSGAAVVWSMGKYSSSWRGRMVEALGEA